MARAPSRRKAGAAAQPASDAARIQLAPVLDLSAAAPLQAELLALRGRPVLIDASNVDRLGALCLQVLVSAHVTWRADGISCSLGARSPSFDDGLAQLGGLSALTQASGVEA